MSEINCILSFAWPCLKCLQMKIARSSNSSSWQRRTAVLVFCWWPSPFLTSTHFVASMCNFHFPCSIIEILTLILDISLRLPTHPSKAKLSHLVLLNLFKLEILLNFRRVLASIFHFLCLVLCQLNRICRD